MSGKSKILRASSSESDATERPFPRPFQTMLSPQLQKSRFGASEERGRILRIRGVRGKALQDRVGGLAEDGRGGGVRGNRGRGFREG